jgi:hypothetical protein
MAMSAPALDVMAIATPAHTITIIRRSHRTRPAMRFLNAARP